MAESGPSTSTKTDEGRSETVTVEKNETEDEPVLHLRLQQPKSDHKVKWTSDTVDNEFMGKKKSKCCCIYEKPKVFGESDSSSDDDEDDEGCTPHCRGHKKKCYRHHGHDHKDENGHGPDHEHDHGSAHDGCSG